ncbi:MAG: FAD:protein FMN transferase, partial [Candidatus Moraniibacteriota bacterium]
DILKQEGERYFLVEGGGDMYGTTKRDGSPYRVALEWPGKPDIAFGVVELKHQGVAVSDSFKRRWGKWHHILDSHTKQPIESVLGAAAVAPSAFAADCMTSGLFLAPPAKYGELSRVLEAEYVVFQKDGTVSIGPHWPGELF